MVAPQLNCRRVQDEPNVLEGILHNRFFLYIIGSEALLQFLIVQHGGELFKTAALGWQQWGMCMGFGAGTLLVHRLLSEVPDPAWSPADGESSSAASTP